MISQSTLSRLLGKHIFIYPFDKNNCKGVGYNFTVGPHAWSLTSGKELVKNIFPEPCYEIEAGDTALVWTNETLHVSDKMGGTLHSKVKQATLGFSSISTTLDPGWNGVMLIAITNKNRDRKLNLIIGEPFVTVMFDWTDKPQSSIGNPPISGRVSDLMKGITLSNDANSWIHKPFRQTPKDLMDLIKKEGIYNKLKRPKPYTSMILILLPYIPLIFAAIWIVCVVGKISKWEMLTGFAISILIAIAAVTSRIIAKKL